jgi:hypothetical protein
MFLYQSYGSDFVRKCLEYVPHRDPALLFRNLYFFYQSNVIFDVLIGLDREDGVIIREGLDQLKMRAQLWANG